MKSEREIAEEVQAMRVDMLTDAIKLMANPNPEMRARVQMTAGSYLALMWVLDREEVVEKAFESMGVDVTDMRTERLVADMERQFEEPEE
jgi:hypothetical protein